jgi:hypothetical protein
MLTSVLIDPPSPLGFLQRASFMAEKLGFGVVDAVIKAFDDSGYSKQTAQKVMIQ